MAEPDQNQPNRRKTLDEVRDERRAERIEAVKDPGLRRELDELVTAREIGLSEMREVHKQRFQEFVEGIREQRRASRVAPVSTAEAEVTIQYSGQLRGEAGRHNNIIDQKLGEYEQTHGKTIDWRRSLNDGVYRRVITEEGRAQATRQLDHGRGGLGR